MKIKNPLLNFKRNKISYLLGIDIRQNFIRLVELSYCDFKYRIEACANIALTESATHDEIIVSAIKNILKQSLSKTKSVAIALPHTVVVFKEAQVAADLSPKEINEFLCFNFMKDIGGSKESLLFDYQMICDPAKAANSLNKLQSVAVRQEYTAKRMKLLRAANLCPKVIDVDVYALERAIRRQLTNIAGLSVVINIEYGYVLIVGLDSKKIVYMQEEIIDKGGLESISQILELLDAKLKLIYSVLPNPFYQLILGGARATSPGLIDAVKDRFNIQVMMANPFLGMELSAAVTPESVSQVSSLMLISYGLALRVSDDDKN